MTHFLLSYLCFVFPTLVNKGFLPSFLMVLLLGCEPVTAVCVSSSVWAKETAAIALWPLLVVAMAPAR